MKIRNLFHAFIVFILIAASNLVFAADGNNSAKDKQKAGESQKQKDGVQAVAGLEGIISPQAKLERIAGDFKFTEGPAEDAAGDVYFTDIPANRIYKWTTDGKLSVFREESGGANGLYFDKHNNLVACEGDNGRVVSINPEGVVTPLAYQYGGKRFNKPNDLWIDPKGGIYFSDPAYGVKPVQDGEHVYYLAPGGDEDKVIRVINDMVRPNGLIGTADGKILYATDRTAKKTYKYEIKDDGTLANKQFFAPVGSDGMTIDEKGNVYLTDESVVVYDAAGKKIGEIKVSIMPTNVTFGGKDRNILFITARTSVFYIPTLTKGVTVFQKAIDGNIEKEKTNGSF